MKRIISVLLCTAMLITLLSVTASAAVTISSLDVAFSLPKVGDTISTTQNYNATTSTNQDTLCCIHSIFTDSSAIENIEGGTAVNLSTLNNYISIDVNHTAYTNQKYLFVLFFYVEDNAPDNTTSITAGDDVTGKYLFTENEDHYFYLTFTPSQNNASTIEGAQSTSFDVTAQYDASVAPETVYSVDITWGPMAFFYRPMQGTWNPATHVYDGKKEAGWFCEPNANMISIINHSNCAITASLAFAATESSGITGKFYNSADTSQNTELTVISLPTADNTSRDEAPAQSAFLRLSGILDKEKTSSAVVGTVTVTIW